MYKQISSIGSCCKMNLLDSQLGLTSSKNQIRLLILLIAYLIVYSLRAFCTFCLNLLLYQIWHSLQIWNPLTSIFYYGCPTQFLLSMISIVLHQLSALLYLICIFLNSLQSSHNSDFFFSFWFQKLNLNRWQQCTYTYCYANFVLTNSANFLCGIMNKIILNVTKQSQIFSL